MRNSGNKPFRRNRDSDSTSCDKIGFPRRRAQRLQVMMSHEEMADLEDFQFRTKMPSQAAAVRELLRRGLAVEGK